MEKTVLLSSAYLPPVSYFSKLYAYEKVCVERFDHYMKQSYRNRCVIASAAGPLSLTIPTEKSEDPKCLMKDVRISDHGNWRHVHWNAFVAAYKQSPFFDYYADEFHEFFEKRYSFLFDFNTELCNWLCEQLDMHPVVTWSDDFIVDTAGMDDFREQIHPKKRLQTEDASFKAVPYYQVFQEKQGFQADLSVADLLFNMGPEGLLGLRDSILR